MITKPTRITTISYTLIDNIYTNELCVPIDNGILVNDISDHLPIFTLIKFCDCIEKPDIVQETYKYARVPNENTIGLLQNHLQLCDWQTV